MIHSLNVFIYLIPFLDSCLGRVLWVFVQFNQSGNPDKRLKSKLLLLLIFGVGETLTAHHYTQTSWVESTLTKIILNKCNFDQCENRFVSPQNYFLSPFSGLESQLPHNKVLFLHSLSQNNTIQLYNLILFPFLHFSPVPLTHCYWTDELSS